jgi:hypothetical protein
MTKTASEWRQGTKRRLIAECLERGLNKRETYATLKPMVADQIRPMIFMSNEFGGRTPKPIAVQFTELKNEIGRVSKEMGRSKDNRFESEEIPHEEIVPPTEDEIEDEPEIEEIPDDRETFFTARSIKDELKYFGKRVKEIRRFCLDRKKRFSQTVDNISMRPVQMAAKLIPAGIPADTLLLTMTMHWEPEIRREAGIDSWDFTVEGSLACHPDFLAISRWVMNKREIDSEGKHELFGYALILAENRVPIMLIGPAGTGKSHLAKQVAEFSDMEYAETPMSTGASRGDLLGRHTISQDRPFIASEFSGIYGSGGMFNFEEIDRADPGVVITLNNALAGQALYNSVNGEKIERHPDFIAVSTANTFGLGANREYTAAERLDAATLDRFRMGRIFLPIDESLEDDLLHGRA